MDLDFIKKLTLTDFEGINKQSSLNYEILFQLINYCDDTKVIAKARNNLYDLIASDFLNNYLKDDFYDESRKESFDIFNFFKKYIKNQKKYLFQLKEFIISNNSEKSIKTVWNYLNIHDFTLFELSKIINHCKIKKIQEEAWGNFIENAESHLKSERKKTVDDIFEALFNICNDCKNELYTSESWRLLKRYEYSNDTYLQLIFKNDNLELIEYAWRHLDINNLNDENLIDIVKETQNKKLQLKH